MKKVLIIVFDLLLVFIVILALGFSKGREKETLCTELKINMIDTLNAGFLKKADIEKIILTREEKILGYPLAGINIRELESRLREQAYIKNAQIYSSIDGTLNVDIIQRQPVVRIITGANHSYYLDKEGFIFPSRTGFTPHVLIANGYFTEGNELKGLQKLDQIHDLQKYDEWFGALKLALYIKESEFWRNQLVQLYYNGRGDFELIPRVGAHQIIFGDASDMEIKFHKLLTLYEEGLNYEGWNNYEKINLKYNNQVICTKR